jgi:transcriptional regulator with XRE-family HTH domain
MAYEELAAFAAGDIDAERRAETEAHVSACGECRGRLAALRELDAALGGLRRAEPSARAVLEARRALSREVRGTGTPEVMTLDEVAEFLRISPDELDEIAGYLPAFEIAGRIRVRRERLIEWIEDRELVHRRNMIASSVSRTLSREVEMEVA